MIRLCDRPSDRPHLARLCTPIHHAHGHNSHKTSHNPQRLSKQPIPTLSNTIQIPQVGTVTYTQPCSPSSSHPMQCHPLNRGRPNPQMSVGQQREEDREGEREREGAKAISSELIHCIPDPNPAHLVSPCPNLVPFLFHPMPDPTRKNGRKERTKQKTKKRKLKGKENSVNSVRSL